MEYLDIFPKWSQRDIIYTEIVIVSGGPLPKNKKDGQREPPVQIE